MNPGTTLARLPRTIPRGAFHYPRPMALAGLGFDKEQAEFEAQQAKEERQQNLLLTQLSWAREDYQQQRLQAEADRQTRAREASDARAAKRWSEAQESVLTAAKEAAERAQTVNEGLLVVSNKNLKWVLGAATVALGMSYVLFAKKVGKRKPGKAAS